MASKSTHGPSPSFVVASNVSNTTVEHHFSGEQQPTHHLHNHELSVSLRAPGAASEHGDRRLPGQIDGTPAVIGGGRAAPPVTVPSALLLLLG